MKGEVSHEGKAISPACASCQIAGLCGTPVKRTEIDDTACSDPSRGLRAAVIAYLVPLILLIASVFILGALGVGELWAGLGAVGIAALYYFIIWLINNRNKPI